MGSIGFGSNKHITWITISFCFGSCDANVYLLSLKWCWKRYCLIGYPSRSVFNCFDSCIKLYPNILKMLTSFLPNWVIESRAFTKLGCPTSSLFYEKKNWFNQWIYENIVRQIIENQKPCQLIMPMATMPSPKPSFFQLRCLHSSKIWVRFFIRTESLNRIACRSLHHCTIVKSNKRFSNVLIMEMIDVCMVIM